MFIKKVFVLLTICINLLLADSVKIIKEYDKFTVINASTSFVKGTNVSEIEAKDGCIENAKLLASKKAYLNIYSEREVINGKLTKSIVKAISDNLLTIDTSKVTKKDTKIATIYDCTITVRIKQNKLKNGNILYPKENKFIISNKKYSFEGAKKYCTMNNLKLPSIAKLKQIRTNYVGFKDNPKYKFHIQKRYIPYMPTDEYVSFWSITNREDFDDEYYSLDFSMGSKNIAHYSKNYNEQYVMCVE